MSSSTTSRQVADPSWVPKAPAATSLGPVDPSWLAKLSSHLGILPAKTVSPLLMSIWPGASIAAIGCREACACLMQADAPALPLSVLDANVRHAFKRRGLQGGLTCNLRSIIEADRHFVLDRASDGCEPSVRLDKAAMPAPAVASLYLSGNGAGMLTAQRALFQAALHLTWPRALTDDDDYLCCQIGELLLEEDTTTGLDRHSMHLTDVGGALRQRSDSDARLAIIFPKGQGAKSRRPRLSEFLGKEELKPLFQVQESKLRQSEKVVTLRTDVLLRALGPMAGLLQTVLVPSGTLGGTTCSPPEAAWSASDGTGTGAHESACSTYQLSGPLDYHSAPDNSGAFSGDVATSGTPLHSGGHHLPDTLGTDMCTAESARGGATGVNGSQQPPTPYQSPPTPGLFVGLDAALPDVPPAIRICWEAGANGQGHNSKPQGAMTTGRHATPTKLQPDLSAQVGSIGDGRALGHASHNGRVGITPGLYEISGGAGTGTGGNTAGNTAASGYQDGGSLGQSYNPSEASDSTPVTANCTWSCRMYEPLPPHHGGVSQPPPDGYQPHAMQHTQGGGQQQNGIASMGGGGLYSGMGNNGRCGSHNGGGVGGLPAGLGPGLWGGGLWGNAALERGQGGLGSAPGRDGDARETGIGTQTWRTPLPDAAMRSGSAITGMASGGNATPGSAASTSTSRPMPPPGAPATTNYAAVLRTSGAGGGGSGLSAGAQQHRGRDSAAGVDDKSIAVADLRPEAVAGRLEGASKEVLGLLPPPWSSFALEAVCKAAREFCRDGCVSADDLNHEFLAVIGHLLATNPQTRGLLERASAGTARQLMQLGGGAGHDAPTSSNPATASNAQAPSAVLLLKPSVRTEIQALVDQHSGVLRMEHFDAGVVCHLQRKPESVAVAALREIAKRSDFFTANNMPAYLTHWLMKLGCEETPPPHLSSAGKLLGGGKSAQKPDLRRLPRGVQVAIEKLVDASPWIDWRHFDAGVMKVLQQLALTAQDDALAEIRQVEVSELSSVKNMPAYLNKCFNNRLWKVRY